jgi:hypothetical protein
MIFPETSNAGLAPGDSLVMREAEARYARERYQIYKAKAYGPRATNPARLRELERAWRLAEQRLHRARSRRDTRA